MPKAEMIEAEGIVTDVLPNATFKVDVMGHSITAHLSGKLRTNFIRVLRGDRVKLEMSPYDTTKGRIVWRTK